MATKYFLGNATPGEYSDNGNWWLNADGTGATTKATSSDDAILLANLTSNGGDPAEINSLTTGNACQVAIDISCATCTIANDGYVGAGGAINCTTLIMGGNSSVAFGGVVWCNNANCPENSGCYSGGSIYCGGIADLSGTAHIHTSSLLHVDDLATFLEAAYCLNSSIEGNVEFHGDSYLSGGTANGDALFTDDAYFIDDATVVGVATLKKRAEKRAENRNGVGSLVVVREYSINGSSILGMI